MANDPSTFRTACVDDGTEDDETSEGLRYAEKSEEENRALKPLDDQQDLLVADAASNTALPDDTEKTTSSLPPLWAWFALVVAVVACSSGGVWFALLDESPAILRAAWRLCMTALLQFPGWIRDFRRADKDLRQRYFRSFPYLTVAGVALAAHFSSWSISLNLTSLSHSLLFVCTTPILLVTYQGIGWITLGKWLTSRFPHPPTWIEVLGTAIGFLAAALLAQEAAASTAAPSGTTGIQHQREPSLGGDLIATFGAATMGIYLLTGASIRKWLSIWLYVFPVTLISGLLAAVVSLLFESETTVYGTGSTALFGFFGTGERFGLVIGAAITAGILGHTLANLALEHISPLIVSVLLLNEPLIGSLIGFIVGVQAAPSLVTMLAGIPLMFAAGLVSLGSRESALYKIFTEWKDKRKQGKLRFQVLNDSPLASTELSTV